MCTGIFSHQMRQNCGKLSTLLHGVNEVPVTMTTIQTMARDTSRVFRVLWGMILAVLVAESSAARLRTLVTIMVDDMGWYDSQINNPLAPTPRIGELLAESLHLDRL